MPPHQVLFFDCCCLLYFGRSSCISCYFPHPVFVFFPPLFCVHLCFICSLALVCSSLCFSFTLCVSYVPVSVPGSHMFPVFLIFSPWLYGLSSVFGFCCLVVASFFFFLSPAFLLFGFCSSSLLFKPLPMCLLFG